MIRTALAVAITTVALTLPAAADTIRIGFISTFSGPAASSGEYAEAGMNLFQQMNPDAFCGHDLEIIKRDDTGPNADVARRLAQELIVQNDVDLITGLQFTPNAFAALEITNKANIPVVVQNAATSSITEASEYVVRVSRTLWGSAYPLGTFTAEELGAKTAIVMFSDYAPGRNARDAFIRAFTDSGGEILDIIPLPFPSTPDFTPFLQRVNAAQPDALFVFVPSGKYATNFVNTYDTMGLSQSTQLVGPFDIAPPSELPLMGAGIENAVIVGHYSQTLDNPANIAFLNAWKAEHGDRPVDPFAVQGHDAMAAIAHAICATDGDFDGASFTDALRGWQYDSPRGPLTIDAETRDAVQNQYVIRLERGEDGTIVENIIKTIENVGDPWKDLGIGD